ncbi:hypothetical protein BEN47_18090 [Hymenobacter lapidarius]|uniref:Outer membrane protein beta-barrel domain-containing protein n=1 Tax=Hymenobacter lapidarius TaxID=1908237 RepID=A0A1G1SW66_9BACT|nr:hypothetical protein BEN47_18090 [Hymenobacter lapidarius]
MNFVYTVRGVQLFAGPYAALGLGGRQRGTSYSASPSAKFAPFHFNEKIRYDSDVHNPRLDAGVNFGIGYRRGPVQVQFGYQIGLVTLQRAHIEGVVADFPYHDFNADAAYNRVVQLTGTYFLKL